MSFAFATVILFILVIPGIAFKTAYLSTEYSIRDTGKSLIDSLFWATIPSIIFHLIGLNIATTFTGFKADFELISSVFTSQINERDLKLLVSNFILYIKPITIYSIWISLITIPLAHLCRVLVRFMGLDIRFNIFRFNNKWRYLLKGESIIFDSLNKRRKRLFAIDSIFIDALVNENKCSILYQGFLQNFYVNKDGSLDTLVLNTVHKKKFDIKSTAQKTYKIPCTQFILPYKNVLNLNLRYITISAPKYEKIVKKTHDYIFYAEQMNYLKIAFIHITFILFISSVSLFFMDANYGLIVFFGIISLVFLGLCNKLNKHFYKINKNAVDEIIEKTSNLTFNTLDINNITD